MHRRTALKWIVRGIGAATALIVGGPAVLTLLSPVVRERRGPAWRPVGPLDSFAVGEIRQAAIELPDGEWPGTLGAQGVFVWRRERDLVVYSRACTDLSCPVTYDRGSDWFFCPCHGGIFNKEGEPTAGPPAYPLHRYRWRVRDGVLEVDLRSVPAMT